MKMKGIGWIGEGNDGSMVVWCMKFKELKMANNSHTSHVYKKLDRVLYPLSTKVSTKIISYIQYKILGT